MRAYNRRTAAVFVVGLRLRGGGGCSFRSHRRWDWVRNASVFLWFRHVKRTRRSSFSHTETETLVVVVLLLLLWKWSV